MKRRFFFYQINVFSTHTIGGAYGLMAMRALVGFFQGPLHPSLSSFGIAWYPVGQRGVYCSMITIGISVIFNFQPRIHVLHIDLLFDF